MRFVTALEKLVNNFVVEDKVRLAASRQRLPSKTLPSSIQFEKNSIQQQQQQDFSSEEQPDWQNNQVTKSETGEHRFAVYKRLPFANKPSQIVKSLRVSTKTHHHREVLLETIEDYPSPQT
ncbi:hypothetical protein K0M31_001281 [Melipona bicolor]|uniref:Uncharacterized protein n=1 Tax=Melipona bicolor TaxID=60889 RepID=A0AA40KY20_9HYME|nr:hypothetical protein K0M31_001281 [Melipona bicolor]